LATGPAETIAAAVTAIAALRLPLLAATALGVAAVAMLRAMGL
ncbi:MAG TPA: AzlD family protein, partial [Rhizobium sp.]|nr:AzlD family protein [Rhizobium sp.]